MKSSQNSPSSASSHHVRCRGKLLHECTKLNPNLNVSKVVFFSNKMSYIEKPGLGFSTMLRASRCFCLFRGDWLKITNKTFVFPYFYIVT